MFLFLCAFSLSSVASGPEESRLFDYFTGALPPLEMEMRFVTKLIKSNPGFYEGIIFSAKDRERKVYFLKKAVSDEALKDFPAKSGKPELRTNRICNLLWLASLSSEDQQTTILLKAMEELDFYLSVSGLSETDGIVQFLRGLTLQVLGYISQYRLNDRIEAISFYQKSLEAYFQSEKGKTGIVGREDILLLEGYNRMQLAKARFDDGSAQDSQSELFKAIDTFQIIRNRRHSNRDVLAESYICHGMANCILGDMYKKVYSDFFRLELYNREARKWFVAVKTEFPDQIFYHPEALALEGVSYQAELKYEKAAEVFSRLQHDYHGGRWEYFCMSNLAEVYFQLKKFEDCTET
ncbi:MAG: hypothetical protein PHQ23_14150, partial [Candidatus Wallbacteria bacterium]|nr:hypothetical protein [Candidatus Wallbacteria bacterium]